MYPEEHKLNMIERQLIRSRKSSEELKENTDEKYSDVSAEIGLRFLKFSNEV